MKLLEIDRFDCIKLDIFSPKVIEDVKCLIENNSKKIISATEKIMDGKWKKGKVPELWDGKTAERIVSFLRNIN